MQKIRSTTLLILAILSIVLVNCGVQETSQGISAGVARHLVPDSYSTPTPTPKDKRPTSIPRQTVMVGSSNDIRVEFSAGYCLEGKIVYQNATVTYTNGFQFTDAEWMSPYACE